MMEGWLLRDNGSTGQPIIFIFTGYHVLLAAFFVVYGYLQGFEWLPSYILIQDFCSHGIEYLIDKDVFWSQWITFPFTDIILGLPFIYWILLITQVFIYLKVFKRRW